VILIPGCAKEGAAKSHQDKENAEKKEAIFWAAEIERVNNEKRESGDSITSGGKWDPKLSILA
jgi:hypothetical protein